MNNEGTYPMEGDCKAEIKREPRYHSIVYKVNSLEDKAAELDRLYKKLTQGNVPVEAISDSHIDPTELSVGAFLESEAGRIEAIGDRIEKTTCAIRELLL